MSCDVHFLVPCTVFWSPVSGKLRCHGCGLRLGNYDWSGGQCSCGAWVTPFVQITKTRVDVKGLNLNLLSRASPVYAAQAEEQASEEKKDEEEPAAVVARVSDSPSEVAAVAPRRVGVLAPGVVRRPVVRPPFRKPADP